jgi:hypothetical protein
LERLSQFVTEVRLLFIRNSFQQFFCLRALVSTEIPFVQTEVGLEQDPRCDPRLDRLSQVRSSNDSGHCDATSRRYFGMSGREGCRFGRGLTR